MIFSRFLGIHRLLSSLQSPLQAKEYRKACDRNHFVNTEINIQWQYTNKLVYSKLISRFSRVSLQELKNSQHIYSVHKIKKGFKN